MANVIRRLYWRCRAWWARVERRLRGYPPRPPLDDILGRIAASEGSKAEGYPCPKDGTALTLLEGGAWCPKCKTVWREIGEVPI